MMTVCVNKSRGQNKACAIYYCFPRLRISLPLTRTDSNLEGPPEPSMILALIMRKDDSLFAGKSSAVINPTIIRIVSFENFFIFIGINLKKLHHHASCGATSILFNMTYIRVDNFMIVAF